VNIASGQTLTVAEAGTNTYSGVIGGAGGLTKTGAGVLLLDAANTFTGGIVVNAGTLAITNGAGNRLGGITSGTTNAAALTLNGGTLQVRQGFQIAGERGFTIGANGGTIDVISGVDYGGPNIISGPGNTLTKTGAGTLYSTAANTIGGLIVAGGTFKAENANALQNANVTLNGGNVTFGLSVTNFTFGGLTATNSGAGYDLALTNVTTGAAVALTIGNGGGSSTYAGVLSGAGSIIKTGTGTFTLSSINTYTGATTINAGTLAFSTSGSLYSGGSSAGTITVNNGGTLLFNRQDVFGNADSASAVTITVNSGGLINNGGVFNNLNNLTLNGGELRASGGSSGGWNAYLLNNVTVGGSSASSITANTSVNANNSILLSRAGTTTFNVGSTGDAAGDLLVSARLTDGNGVTGSLTKTGAGKMVLSGANTYTGNTSVSAGELALGAANVLSDSTAVSVTGGTLNMGANNDTVSSFTLNGGTLGGTGTLTASTYALQSGTLNAVLGVGSITVSSGTTTLGSASRLNSSSSLAVNSGTLTLGGNESVAGLSGSGGTIALGGNTLTTTSNSDSSAAAAITGTGGALTKAGTGNLTLSGNSSYTGTTTINAGTITISHANALGNTTGSTTVADQATLALSGGINTAENISITGTGVGGNGALRNVSGVNTNSGTVSLAGNATISADNETTLQLGNIDNGVNTRAVTFDGAGTIRLTGNFANTGTNTTWQKNGTGELIISNTSANTAGLQLQVANGKVTLAAGTFSTNTTTSTRGLDFGLTSAGAGSSGNTEFYVNGGVTMSNTVYVASGTGTRTMGTESTSGTATYNGEIYLDNNLVLSAANGGEAAFSGNIVNNGAITKAGAGKVSLSGANTSVGAILINAGTLAISGGSAINNANSVAVASGATFEVNGSETINALSGAGSVVLASGQQLRSRFDTTSSTFSGGMSGAGQFLKGGSGTLVLSGANSYSGLTTFEAGTILAGHNDAFGTSTVMFDWSDNSAKTLAANGATARTIANSIQIYNNLTLGQSTVNTGSLTFSGGVALGDEVGTREITVADGTSHTFSGVVSGLRGIVKKGAGSLTLSGNNTFSGASYLVGGTTVLSGNTGAGSGGLFLGETSGSDTATLALTNGVSLSNALEVRAGSTGLAKIVAQGGANTLSGALTGSKSFEMEAADGATLTVSGNISGGNTIGIRGAGTGKVVLTGNNNTSTKFDLWSGTLEAGAADDLGNNTGNFIGNKLYFDGGTLGATGTFTLGGANGITLGAGGGGIRVAADQTLTLQGYITDGSSTGVTFTKSGAGTLFLDKTEINDFSGTTLVVSEGTLSTWNPGLLSSTVQLGGSATTGTYRFQKTDGAGSTGVNFQVNAGGGQIDVGTDDLTASGTVSGSGALTKIGSGRLTLSGANTNSGGVTLSAGKLRLNSTNALGTGSLAQSSGASTLEINTTGTISNAMSIYNVNTLQTVTLSGNKTLNNATYDVATSTTTTESGLLSGTSGVTKVGAGTLILSGSSGNTFSGASAVNAGTLQLQKTSGNAISGSSIAVNSGGTLLLGASNQIGNETALNLAGGTFSLAGNTDTVGRLTVSANSIFDFGTAGGSATTFTFADFDTAAYGNNTYVMTVNNAAVGSSIVFNTNYDGNATFNSFASKIQYGGSGQFGQISFGAGTTTLLVAIPDARVYSAAVALIFLIGIAEVRRRRQRATRGEA
jgi:autotransporter-associated beta strand protein